MHKHDWVLITQYRPYITATEKVGYICKVYECSICKKSKAETVFDYIPEGMEPDPRCFV